MHTRYSGSQTPSHSNELENRLTKLEGLEPRVTTLERMLMGIIYALGALTAGKTGDFAEIVLNILKAKS